MACTYGYRGVNGVGIGEVSLYLEFVSGDRGNLGLWRRLRRDWAGAIVVKGWAALIADGIGELRVQRFRCIVCCCQNMRCVLQQREAGEVVKEHDGKTSTGGEEKEELDRRCLWRLIEGAKCRHAGKASYITVTLRRVTSPIEGYDRKVHMVPA